MGKKDTSLFVFSTFLPAIMQSGQGYCVLGLILWYGGFSAVG